jgi:hypothetical protein
MIVNRRITTRGHVDAARTEREGPTLDFKGDVNPAEWWELAKDIAAFANHIGGVILVGAFEREDRLAEFRGIDPTRAEQLAERYDKVARDNCRPSVIARAHVIPWDDAKAIVAVNVEAYPAALVGSQFYAVKDAAKDEPEKRKPGNAWQFPVRHDDDTSLISPEVMPMYMNANVRRTIIMLSQIPAKDYTRLNVDAVYDLEGRAFVAPISAALRNFSIDTNAADLIVDGHALSIPLDEIQTVWRDDIRSEWFIGVSGRVQRVTRSAGVEIVYLRGRP